MSTSPRYRHIGCSRSSAFPKAKCPSFEQSTVETQIRLSSVLFLKSFFFPKSFWWSLAFPVFFNLHEQAGTTLWKCFRSLFLGFATKTLSDLTVPTEKLTCKSSDDSHTLIRFPWSKSPLVSYFIIQKSLLSTVNLEIPLCAPSFGSIM